MKLHIHRYGEWKDLQAGFDVVQRKRCETPGCGKLKQRKVGMGKRSTGEQ
jgi:hypothetical protein